MLQKSIDLIIQPTFIVPVIPEGKVFHECSLVVNDGVIIDLLPNMEALRKYQAEETVILNNQVVMPGLINTHGHAAMSLLRGFADDYPLNQWLEEHIWPAEAQHVSESFCRDGVTLACAEMLRSGTTCFSDMYFFPDVTAQVAKDTGMRAQVFFPVIGFPTAWASSDDEYIQKGLALLDLFRSHELIDIGFGPHAPYTVSDELFSRIATLAEETNSSIQVHLHETQREVDDSIKQFHKRPIERLFELGVLGPKTQAVHMTALNDEDIQYITDSNTRVVHCPKSNLKLASGFAPIHNLLDQDICVAIGTDGAASNNKLDMFDEMQTASLLGKAVANNAAAMNAATTLRMATLDGAKAMGIDDVTGSIEIGKSADVISLSLDELSTLPHYNLISQLVYSTQSSQVTNSWVKGRQLLKDRTLMSIDEISLRQRCEMWQKRISQRES